MCHILFVYCLSPRVNMTVNTSDCLRDWYIYQFCGIDACCCLIKELRHDILSYFLGR